MVDGINSSHEVVIERASGSEGPWTEVDVVAYNSIGYQDEITAWRGFHTLLFYRLTVREIATPENILVRSKPITTSKGGSKITSEIIRQHEITLRGVNTHPGYGAWDFALYKRTKHGTLCTSCTDPYTGERGTVARCEQCQGTGYIEGWTLPVTFRLRWMTPVPKSTIIEAYGSSEEIVRQAWTAAYPIIEPGDMMVEKDTGRVWKTLNISSSEPNGVVVSQSLTLMQVDKQKIEGSLFFPGEEV